MRGDCYCKSSNVHGPIPDVQYKSNIKKITTDNSIQQKIVNI
jgi:hypothetical protein